MNPTFDSPFRDRPILNCILKNINPIHVTKSYFLTLTLILLLHLYVELPHSRLLSDFHTQSTVASTANNTDNYVPLNVEHRHYQVVLYSQRNHTISRHTHECDSVYARKKYTDISTQVSTKHTKA